MSGLEDSSNTLVQPIVDDISELDYNSIEYSLVEEENFTDEAIQNHTIAAVQQNLGTEIVKVTQNDEVLDLGFPLDDESIDYSSLLEKIEIAAKIGALAGYMYFGGTKMALTYASGLAATAIATVINNYWDHPYSNTVANAILTIELGFLKNYGMATLFEQLNVAKAGPVVDAANFVFGNENMNTIIEELTTSGSFHTTIDKVGLIKWFGLAIPLNLLVTFMAESYGMVQNKLFLNNISNGELELDIDPFLTKRGPFTVVKRTAKNIFSVMNPDIFELQDTNGKTMLKLAGHYFANVPIALYYNMDKPFSTATKTLSTSLSKVFGERIIEGVMKYSGLFEKSTIKLVSIICGTTSYVVSKILTKTG